MKGLSIFYLLALFSALGLSTSAAEDDVERKTVIQINPQVLDPPAPGDRNAANEEARVAEMLRKELQTLQSDRVLNLAIDRLDLPTRWKLNRIATLRKLRGLVKTERVRGTDLITIHVRGATASESAQISSAIANSFREFRIEQERKRANAAMDALAAEVRTQEDLVEQKKKALHAVVKRVGVPAGDVIPFDTRKQRFLEIQGLRKRKGDDRLRFAAGIKIADNPVTGPFEKMEQARQTLKNLKAEGAKPIDPAVLTQTRLVNSHRDAAEKAIPELLRVLDHEIEMSLRKPQVEKDPDPDKLKAYNETKNDYEKASALLKTMKVKHATLRIALKIPKSPVTIQELPAKKQRAVR